MRRTATLLAVAALGGASASASAQGVAAYERRLDSLVRAAHHASAVLAAHDDSVARVRVRTDTLQFGPVRVAAEPAVADVVRAIGARVADSLSRDLGTATERLTPLLFVVRLDGGRPGREARRATTADVTAFGPTGAELRGWRTNSDPAGLEATLRRLALYAVFVTSQPELLTWIGGVVPTDSVHTSEWAGHRLSLVSSPTSVGLRCYQGELSACRIALGIDPVVDPIVEWHDADRRQRLVRDRQALASRVNARGTTACLRGSDSACVETLHQMPRAVASEPVSANVRQSVVRHALYLGGEGAMERLVTTSGDRAAQIQAAAGVPIDSVIRRWQSRLRETRVPSRDLSGEITLVTLAWVAGLGALSMRSSRWR